TTVPFTLSGTAVSGTDYSGVTANPLVIPAGKTSGTITGTLLADPGSNQTLTITLSAPTNATLGSITMTTLTIVEPAKPTPPAPPPPPPTPPSPPPAAVIPPPAVGVAFASGVSGARSLSGQEVLVLVSSSGVLTQSDATGSHQLGAGVRSASVAFGPSGEVLL